MNLAEIHQLVADIDTLTRGETERLAAHALRAAAHDAPRRNASLAKAAAEAAQLHRLAARLEAFSKVE